jgi:hypothetical protein
LIPLIFKDWLTDRYAKIGHATMVDGKLQSRAIDDQTQLACSAAASSSI